VASFPYRIAAPRPPEAIVPLPDEATRLGPLRKTYVPPPLWRTLLFPTLLSLMLLVVAVCSTGAYNGFVDLASLLLIVLGFGGAAVLIMAWTPLRLRHVEIDLHVGGLVTRRRDGRDVVIFEDVSEVWFHLERLSHGGVRTTGLRLVELSGGGYQVSGHVEDAIGLLDAVLRRCSEPLVAEARSALQEGEVLTFGDVLLDRDGITLGDTRCPWSELRLVRFQQGKTLFLRQAPAFAWRTVWGTVKHDAIPHPTVFLRLVSELAPRSENDPPVAGLLK
jgi:hypothetical protein